MAESIIKESYSATGLPGTTAGTRYVGATASGAPTTGTFLLGDHIVDQTGAFWVCTIGGTPGSWSKVGGALATVNITGQTAAQSATTLYTTTTSGLYTVNYYAKVTTAATTNSSLGAFTVISTAPDSTISTTVGQTTSQNSTTSGFISGTITVFAASGTAIQYSCGYSSSGATAMQYSLYAAVAGATNSPSTGTVSSFNGRTGAVVPATNDYLAVPTGGLTGAVAATRYVGGTTSGAPVSGTFAVGDFVVDQTGKMYVCTVAGTPGTWVQVGSPTTSVTMGGDVTGSSATSTVAKIQGTAVSATAPTTSQVLTYNGTSWAPATAGGGALTYVQSFPGGSSTSFGSLSYTLITSMSITSGTWLINFQAAMSNATYAMGYQCVVSTSSTVASGIIGGASGMTVTGSNQIGSMSGSVVYVSGSTQTIYLHIVAQGPSNYWYGTATPNSSVKTSGMSAVKIA